jgi:hypothetical protein
MAEFTDRRQAHAQPLPKHLLPADLEKMTAKRKPRKNL